MSWPGVSRRHLLQALYLVILTTPSMMAQDPGGASDGMVRDTLQWTSGATLTLRPFVLGGSETVWINGLRVDSTAYSLDTVRGRLDLRLAGPDSAAVVVWYRVLPFRIADSYALRRYAPLPPDSIFLEGFTEPGTQQPARSLTERTDDGRLQRSGSISRGIIAGNNRDVALESGLRLQLSGEVAEGVTVQAVLSDENTPIQPDGTTQRLSEFDRVFIQLQSRSGTATLGDYDLRMDPSEFAPFNRKLQGVSLAGAIPDVPGRAVGSGAVTVAGATSRGIYRAQPITPIEGVQGPYRLQGERGEQFIIVIANSERVYLDGQLLTRGETNDYVIDYAAGEVTFTSRRIIGEDSRLSVEFEYTTNRFTRTLLAAQASSGFMQRSDGSARLKIQSTVLREADSQSFGQELGLTASDDSLLTTIGDDDVLVPGEEWVVFDPESPFVPYVKQEVPDSDEPVFVAVTDTTGLDRVYRVRFTRVPPGTGSYRRVGHSVNGIQFEWAGEGRGDYIPGRLLPKPRLQQLADLSATFEPVKGLELFGEWAGSGIDQNRRSPLDDEDNAGIALLGGARLKPTTFHVAGRTLGALSAEVRRRHTDARFEAFDRTRSVEFGREWNLDRSYSATGGLEGEDLAEARATFALSESSFLRGGWGRLDLDAFKARRTSWSGKIQEKGLPWLDYALESVRSTDSLLGRSGTWERRKAGIRGPLGGGKVTPLLEVEQERRRQTSLETGKPAQGSFSFLELRPGLELELPRATLRTTIERRSETGLAEDTLRDRAHAWTGQAGILLKPNSNLQTEADIGYRAKRYTEYYRIQRKEPNSESIAVRWTGRYSPLKRSVITNWFYEALTEKTPILQETYVRAGPEIGQYIWEDANGDGIRQVDEFIPERLPNEGVYSRVFVPSDTLEPVINVQARLRVNLEPSRLFARESTSPLRWSRFLSSQTSLEVSEKSKEEVLRKIYLLNLRYFDRASTTVNGRTRVEQRFDLFRGQSRYGATLLYSRLKTSAQRTAGRERRTLGTWRADGRVRLSRLAGIRLEGSREESQSSSIDARSGISSDSRTFDITSLNLNPELALTFSRSAQATLAVNWSAKSDRGGGGGVTREARVLKTPVEVRLSRRNRLQLTVRAEQARVTLNGEAFGLAAFELTDGRGEGTSYLWNVFAQYRVSELVNATFSYDGRAPSDARTIHTVRLQVSMLF